MKYLYLSSVLELWIATMYSAKSSTNQIPMACSQVLTKKNLKAQHPKEYIPLVSTNLGINSVHYNRASSGSSHSRRNIRGKHKTHFR